MSSGEHDGEHIATVKVPLVAVLMVKASFWISRKRKRGQSEPPNRRLNLPRLLDGDESEEAYNLRRDTFVSLWKEQETAIDVRALETQVDSRTFWEPSMNALPTSFVNL